MQVCKYTFACCYLKGQRIKPKEKRGKEGGVDSSKISLAGREDFDQ